VDCESGLEGHHEVLVVGAGVIGTVYGVHLAAAGSTVCVLSHGSRTGEVAAAGLSARDVLGGGQTAMLTLMCQAITGAFAALRASGTAGCPRNLAVLHSPLLRAVAVRYWARAMRSPMGELCFAAHARHAEPETRALGRDVTAQITGSSALAELLRL
jgi:choline dehydrogenase-like flavoprotein